MQENEEERTRAILSKHLEKMPDDDWKGPSGPGNYSDDHSSSSRTVPIYVLFLIMLGSGIFTLVLLWVCVQYIYRRRRIRRERADVEGRLEQPPWEFGASAPGVKEVELPEAKKCDAGVELTYVVMAGEDQPTFLARPLSPSEDPPSPSAPNMVDDAHVAVNSEKASALEN